MRRDGGFGDDWFSGGREAILAAIAGRRAQASATEKAGRPLNLYLPALAASRGSPDLALSAPVRLFNSAERSLLRRLARGS